MANNSAKFDEVAHGGLVSIMFIILLPYISIVTLTFQLWPPKIDRVHPLTMGNKSAKFN